MKTAGIIILTIDLLNALYTGFTNVTQEKVVGSEELKMNKENQHTIDWQSCIGIGVMIIGGAFLILGRKKSLTT